MDKIILGILMMKRLTAYEIRNIIRHNFSSMCSDSLGSIQAALKKLLAAGLVDNTEYVENGVNKKQYSITDPGRQEFMNWLKTPIDMSKTKNMDLGKLLLMGLVPKAERAALLDQLLEQLADELEELLQIREGVKRSDGKSQMIAYMERDPDYRRGIQEATGRQDMEANINEISYFENMTLQYGIDETRFHIQWFEDLRANILKGDVEWEKTT